eukprot:scaffold65212_cov36-Phaeocystis_antarctica.AAC.1
MGLRADYIDVPPRAIALLDGAAALWQRMAPGEREAHMQLELVGASSQPGLGATSRGVHNIAMDDRPIAHSGVAAAATLFVVGWCPSAPASQSSGSRPAAWSALSALKRRWILIVCGAAQAALRISRVVSDVVRAYGVADWQMSQFIEVNYVTERIPNSYRELTITV